VLALDARSGTERWHFEVSGRPRSVEMRLKTAVMAGVKLQIADSRRNTVATWVLSNTLRRSSFARSTSSTFSSSSALTVCSSSLTDCSSSFEVSSSSLVDCSSSLIDCALRSTISAPPPRSRIRRSSVQALAGLAQFVLELGDRKIARRGPCHGGARLDGRTRVLEHHQEQRVATVVAERLDAQVDDLRAVVNATAMCRRSTGSRVSAARAAGRISSRKSLRVIATNCRFGAPAPPRGIFRSAPNS
jgi:hypothetical protein